MSFAAVDFQDTITLDASVEQLWPLVSDTSRVNQLVGLPPSRRIEPGENMRQIVHSRYLSVPVTWQEQPFEWVFEQWFESERTFAAPMPVERVITSTELIPHGQQTRILVGVRLINRNILGWTAAQLIVGRRLLGDLIRVYRSFEELARAPILIAPPLPETPHVNTARLRNGLERLASFGARPALVERLAEHLRRMGDADVLKMRPFQLAEQWGADRLDVLKLFLYATRSGLLDLEWDVLCPNCRGASERISTLADLSGEAHCPACNIRYDLNFDESVELRFSVNPDIRDAVDVSYCIGGPANTRHILAQLRLEANSVKETTLRLAPGSYRIRSTAFPGEARLEALEGDPVSAATITVSAGGMALEAQTLAAGICTLRLENRSEADLLLLIEELAWSRYAASAALVTALDEFRQLFSSEVLAPGLGLAVRNLTFLFSDLKDSTTIYDSLGDAPAYARVRDHFTAMRGIIAHWRGALVKTIGDAVMAVFPSTMDAVEAALAIQREFTSGEIARGRPGLRVKLGLHCGTCIAVNANDLLDYFGSTVNIAARVQNESLGGDIVLTEAIIEDPGVQRLLDSQNLEIEQFERSLKGITQRHTLYRLHLFPEVVAKEE